mgnify:CR=1 FL=1|jgi:hypothetical protein
MTYTVARMDGRWVQVVKFAREVAFSTERDWFMVCMDWEKANRKREQYKWVPASTRFETVREFVGV